MPQYFVAVTDNQNGISLIVSKSILNTHNCVCVHFMIFSLIQGPPLTNKIILLLIRIKINITCKFPLGRKRVV